VLVALVLLAVGARAAHLAFLADGEQPDRLYRETSPWPEYEVLDRAGRPLAVSVECFDLTVSPRAMWRSHTPERMAARLAAVLGCDPRALLERLLPAEADAQGRLVPEAPRLLRFDARSAQRVQDWLERGALPEAEGAGPLPGLELVGLESGDWTLAWRPALVLSEDTRRAHLGDDLAHKPEPWTRRLLSDLAVLIDPARLPARTREELAQLDTGAAREALRDALWAELLADTFRVVEPRVDPVTAHALAEVLREESVSPWQVQLRPRLERRHPARRDDVGVLATGEAGAHPLDAFAVLGHWGVLAPDEARAQALRDRDHAPHLLEWDGEADPVDARAALLANQWRPWSGLEKLCGDELSDPRWGDLLRQNGRVYARELRSVARDRRARWQDGRVPDYFASASVAAEVPRCEVTLDATLQRDVHAELLQVMGRFDPALAMAIVVDVGSGDVLAVDAVQAYPNSGFAPTQHVFTPGSTFKAVVMALALERGVVHPAEVFATHQPDGLLVHDDKGPARRIAEAEGAPEEDWITATQGLAQSVNAVLVQIGLRLVPADFRAALVALGYGQRPGAGLGPEAVGHLPALRQGTWRRKWEHASVCFGHEVGVTLWQHAAALATIARGGVRRPLRLLTAVEQDGRRWELPLAPGERVLSERACADVRAMMAVGAREGTGERVANPEHCPELDYVGTKTGTTEKVEAEVCLHVELRHNLAHEAGETSCSKACYRALRGQRDHKRRGRTCYTSSMCALGRLTPEGREVLVFVVVDEPRSKEKFGADVAGASAVRLLRLALHLDPEVDVPPPALAVLPGELDFNGSDLPWADDGALQRDPEATR
jgi:cell division protein FtsI/penicillin-binding protein 2